MVTESIVKEKIFEIVHNHNENDMVDTFFLIFKELSTQPQSVDVLATIDKTIDLVCEEKYG